MKIQLTSDIKTSDIDPIKRTITSSLKAAVSFTGMESKKINGKGYELIFSILLTDNARIRNLNKKYRNMDETTDVLSFPAIDFQGPIFEIPDDQMYMDPEGGYEVQMGDIVISLEKVTEQAEMIGNTFHEELSFLVIHSYLHIIGYDHMDEVSEDAMTGMQKQIIHYLKQQREI